MMDRVHTGLPERLKCETRELHASAERAGVMGLLLRGRLPLAGYAALMHNLHALYEALEGGGPGALPLRIAPLFAPDWRRAEALADDLRWLAASQSPASAPAPARLPTPVPTPTPMPTPTPALVATLAPAMHALVQRVRALRAARSSALAAHAYVRYLGDLHGGQMLAAVVRQAYGWHAEDGTRFYAFGGRERVLALRTALRAALAALDFNPAEADAAAAEARWAFEQHVALFEQLADSWAA
jgi:heme oxygenase